MGLRVILLDSYGKELEIENKVIGEIIFDSEKEIEFFIYCIKTSLLYFASEKLRKMQRKVENFASPLFVIIDDSIMRV